MVHVPQVSRGLAPGLVLGLALAGVGSWASAAPLREVDRARLLWGLLAEGPGALLALPEGAGRWLEASIWWCSAQTGIDGEVARASAVAGWVAAPLILLAGGRPTGALLLLAAPAWTEVLTRRGGEGLAAALLCAMVLYSADTSRPIHLAQGRRPVWWRAAGGAALLGLQEQAAFAAGIMAVLSRQSGGSLLRGAVLPGWSLVGAALLIGAWSGRLAVAPEAWLAGLGGWAWGMPLLARSRAGLGLGVAAAAVGWIGGAEIGGIGVVIALIALAILHPERRAHSVGALLAAGASGGVAGLLPGWLLLCAGADGGMGGAVASRQQAALELRGVRAAGLVGALLFVLPQWSEVGLEREMLRREWALQRQFLEDFYPPSVGTLYIPGGVFPPELDVLYWVQRGAVLAGEPPEGRRPMRIGVLSGVWGDLIPAPVLSPVTSPASSAPPPPPSAPPDRDPAGAGGATAP